MVSRRVTIRDVAEAAGVSRTTVSHVLSNQGRVHPDTRLLVERTAERLGYRANPLAQNLRRDRFGAIGLYLPADSLGYPFYVDLALAASSRAFQHGGGLMLLPPVDEPAELLALPLDGIIIAEPMVDDPVVTALAKSTLPLMLCEAASAPHGPGVHVIDNQHDRVMAELLDHLVSQGARDITILAPAPAVWWGRLIQAAAESWNGRNRQVTVRLHSMPFPVAPERARDSIHSALAERIPDALVVAQQGLGAVTVAAAAAQGLSIPEDLLLACCSDGPDLLATSPAVTAIDLRPRTCGDVAARALIEGLSAERWPVQPELVIRASTQRHSPAHK